MSYGGASDEVAEDFKLALEDLTMTTRYEISNLTIIAKENTEHALAISEVLKDHIKKVAPTKKLPALYLLDSIVKNVGTPYTLFLGRHLYGTFMEAYALADNGVRQRMEVMLKTWKKPVPGSIDTRPVFPPEVTGPIENALIKARTSAMEAHQQYSRSQPPGVRPRPGSAAAYRDTPTPPNGARQATPSSQQFLNPPNSFGTVPQYPPQQSHHPQQYLQQPAQQFQRYGTPPVTMPWQQAGPSLQGQQVPDDSIETLNSDIANLIARTKSDFAQNPYDGTIQTRLKALLDLQGILGSQKLPLDQIVLIRDQVKALSAASRPPEPAPAPQPVPVPATVPPPVTVEQPAVQQPTLASLLGGHNALAALLARASSNPPTSSLPQQNAQPGPPKSYTPPVYQPAAAALPVASAPPQVPNPASLLDQLRAAGLLQGGSGTPQPPQLPGLSAQPTYPPPLPLPPRQTAPTHPSQNISTSDIQLTAASLKIPRPHLVTLLYDRLGAPCTQCGRRFPSDSEGKQRKTRHMDWHFRVHQRMVDAERRGQSRSWFVDEMDWIRSRESDEEHLASSDNAADGAAGGGAAQQGKAQYVAVPDDPVAAHAVCPICQEKFEMKWLDEAQEFVWMDAVRVGSRVYHASCRAETRDSPAPETGVLGKRKNAEDHLSVRTKIKSEP